MNDVEGLSACAERGERSEACENADGDGGTGVTGEWMFSELSP